MLTCPAGGRSSFHILGLEPPGVEKPQMVRKNHTSLGVEMGPFTRPFLCPTKRGPVQFGCALPWLPNIFVLVDQSDASCSQQQSKNSAVPAHTPTPMQRRKTSQMSNPWDLPTASGTLDVHLNPSTRGSTRRLQLLPYLKNFNFFVSLSGGDFRLEMVWGGPN